MKNDLGKKKILVVDDEIISQDITATILSDKYNVLTSKSGKDALKQLVTYKPDLILLDVIMPEMDGWETFHKIRGISLLNQVPIAFLTMLSETDGLEQAKSLGASDYFTKPLDAADFLYRVDKIIEKSHPKKLE